MGSIFRPGLFAEKVAIVTGGGTGIGKRIAHELCELGCKVVIASRSIDKLRLAAQEIQDAVSSSAGHEIVVPIKCNIRCEDDVKHLVQATISRFGRIDFLVNNGGGQFMSSAQDISLKGWEAVVQTNL